MAYRGVIGAAARYFFVFLDVINFLHHSVNALEDVFCHFYFPKLSARRRID
jgi:hypothetical protein